MPIADAFPVGDALARWSCFDSSIFAYFFFFIILKHPHKLSLIQYLVSSQSLWNLEGDIKKTKNQYVVS